MVRNGVRSTSEAVGLMVEEGAGHKGGNPGPAEPQGPLWEPDPGQTPGHKRHPQGPGGQRMMSRDSKAMPQTPCHRPGVGCPPGARKESELQSVNPNEPLHTGGDCETVDWQSHHRCFCVHPHGDRTQEKEEISH